jgi:hypothetical protein
MSYGAHETKIYYVQEATYGVTPSNPTMLGLATADNIEPSLDPGLMTIRGVGSRDPATLRKGLRKVGLKVSYALPSDAPINFLQLITSLNSASIEVLYYKGVFTAPTNVIELLHTGCRMDKVTVECSIEDVIKASADLIGQNVTPGTAKIAGASYADYASAVPWYESYVQKGAADGSSLVAIDRITDWKFTIENNLKALPVINATGYLLKYLQEKHRGLSGELIFEFESIQEYTETINDTEFSLKFGLGGTNSVLFKNCKWDRASIPTKIEDLVSLKASFTARDIIIS